LLANLFRREEEGVIFPLVVSFGVKMINESGHATRSEASPNKISFDKHPSFADRTHLSA
jgi:hypothetical protein